MYRDSVPRYSYQVHDYESLWMRLLDEVSGRDNWRAQELLALMENLETEASPTDATVSSAMTLTELDDGLVGL